MDEFVLVGWQYGQFEIKDGRNAGLMQPYASIFVTQPFTGEENEDYHFEGSKALKFKLADISLLEDFAMGEIVNLFFDSGGKRVVYIKPAD